MSPDVEGFIVNGEDGAETERDRVEEGSVGG